MSCCDRMAAGRLAGAASASQLAASSSSVLRPAHASLPEADNSLPEALTSPSASSERKAVPVVVGLLGPGRVGTELLRIWQQHAACQILPLHGVLNTRHALLSAEPLLVDSSNPPSSGTVGSAADRLLTRLAHSERQSITAFVQQLRSLRAQRHVLIDATASAEVAAQHSSWLRAGIRVVTANKWALAAGSDAYAELQQAGADHDSHYLAATTVMAGLPVLSTLRRLLYSGERIQRISAVLSGSLSALTAACNQGEACSTVLARLQQQGLTEPDPRLDLSGLDVARKLVIMARTIGLQLELEQVDVQCLLPAELLAEPALDLTEHAAQLDRHWNGLSKNLGGKLVYRADLEVLADGSCAAQCRLVGLSADDPMTMLHGSDNQVQITTASYAQQPLLIQGAGAGIAVTARQLFADLLQCWRSA